jgi:hypothetical protein
MRMGSTANVAIKKARLPIATCLLPTDFTDANVKGFGI